MTGSFDRPGTGEQPRNGELRKERQIDTPVLHPGATAYSIRGLDLCRVFLTVQKADRVDRPEIRHRPEKTRRRILTTRNENDRIVVVVRLLHCSHSLRVRAPYILVLLYRYTCIESFIKDEIGEPFEVDSSPLW
jgi:hypothetical protein